MDDPQDTAADALRASLGCRVLVCDDAYWAERRGKRGRPASQMRRQTINANMAKDAANSDWLFHIDADGFIWQDSSLSDELVQVEDANTEVNLTVLDRHFPEGGKQCTLFEGAFRASADLSEEDQKSVYGPLAAMMTRWQYSHGAGNGGVRTSGPLRLGSILQPSGGATNGGVRRDMCQHLYGCCIF
ncbi:MAG: glycosyltransferase family 2 protein [Tateyamaria sp.]|uniref:glycosyltransferase family 2 protein n=1 Tax=Tateyamaria sp. TaxID=1929288 RepID=UPI00329DB9F2